MTALAGAARALIIAGSCCLVTVIARQVTGHGISALWETYPSLLPAAALLAVTGAGLARGTWSAARALGQTTAFHRGARARRVPVPARLARAAARAGIPARRLAAVTASAPFALTYGLFRPRILASTALAADLDGAELAAVLAHEREHVRRRDPLKDLIARILPPGSSTCPGSRTFRPGMRPGGNWPPTAPRSPATPGRRWPAPCSRSPHPPPGQPRQPPR